MLTFVHAPQSAVSRLLFGTARAIEALANSLEASFAAARERQAIQQAAEELRHLDPAILDDIGISLMPASPDWKSIALASPHVMAAQAPQQRKLPR
jgi:hypothetical protein